MLTNVYSPTVSLLFMVSTRSPLLLSSSPLLSLLDTAAAAAAALLLLAPERVRFGTGLDERAPLLLPLLLLLEPPARENSHHRILSTGAR